MSTIIAHNIFFCCFLSNIRHALCVQMKILTVRTGVTGSRVYSCVLVTITSWHLHSLLLIVSLTVISDHVADDACWVLNYWQNIYKLFIFETARLVCFCDETLVNDHPDVERILTVGKIWVYLRHEWPTLNCKTYSTLRYYSSRKTHKINHYKNRPKTISEFCFLCGVHNCGTHVWGTWVMASHKTLTQQPRLV
jgi:hypothetical protein